MAKAHRTTHRSSAGKKLYAVRAADGTFKDIQTFERAHRADLAHHSAAEATAQRAAKKRAAKKAAVKTAAKKTSVKAPRTAAKKR